MVFLKQADLLYHIAHAQPELLSRWSTDKHSHAGTQQQPPYCVDFVRHIITLFSPRRRI
jgi:hypothetical protein